MDRPGMRAVLRMGSESGAKRFLEPQVARNQTRGSRQSGNCLEPPLRGHRANQFNKTEGSLALLQKQGQVVRVGRALISRMESPCSQSIHYRFNSIDTINLLPSKP